MKGSIFDQVLRLFTADKKALKSNWVTAIVSFTVAVTLWFLVVLNGDTFSHTISYPLWIDNKPPSHNYINPPPKTIGLHLHGKGMLLIGEIFKLKKDTLKIDFFAQNKNGTINSNDNLLSIQKKLNPAIKIVFSELDSISLKTTIRHRKKVPVVLDLDPKLPESFKFSTPPILEPDSIYAIGDSLTLKKLKSWKTIALEKKIITNNDKFQLELDSVQGLMPSTKTIYVKLQMEQFTEATIEIPIQIVNVPNNRKVKLEPDKIEVLYQLPISEYRSINESEFGAVIDYKDFHPETTLAIPILKKTPEGLRDVRLSPEAVNYLITEIQ